MFRATEYFKLTDSFIEQYRGKQPKWGPLGYITYKRCVTVETPILTRDLRWVPAGDIQIGTEIIAFDEYGDCEEKGKRKNRRKLRIATITSNSTEEADCVEIELSDGTLLYSTPDHSWLVRKANHKLEWVEARNLLYGKTEKCYMLKYYDVWKEECSYEAGYLAAAFDGEGHLEGQRALHFTQVDNSMFNIVQEYLNKYGFDYTVRQKKKYLVNSKQCYSIRITGNDQVLRFLGMFRPKRLLAIFNTMSDEIQLKRQLFRNKQDIYVVRVTPIGNRKIAVISTSTKTHFTGGFPSHNTYARVLQNENDRTEEFWETLRRVVEGCYTIQLNHCRHFRLPWNSMKAQLSAQEMFRLMWEFKFLPPGRGLWMMGTDLVYQRGSAALNNCSFVSTADINISFSEPFCFLMDMSMLGVGVSFDTLGVNKITIKEPKIKEGVYIAEDSKEGWVDTVRHVLDSYEGKKRFAEIDYSQIRPAGAPIRTFGGVAPGPEPLIACVKEVDIILGRNIGKPLSSTCIVDLMNVIGRCVVSGGVRRSAELALGDINDNEYLQLKDPEKYPQELKDWRWASNNSVVVRVGTDYTKVGEQTAKNGEPGYFWIDNARAFGRIKDGENWKDEKIGGTNPCAEQSLESMEICNLVETFPSLHESLDEYKRTLKFAYLYAKTVTLVPTHNERTNAIMLRNRRIGLSQSGIVEAFEKFGRRKFFGWCDECYGYICKLDKIYSQWLCIPESIKKTTIKPSGTVSLLPGVTPGIHYPHAAYYVRTIRIDKTSPLIAILRKAGYRIEESVAKDNTFVVYFPIKQQNFSRSKNDVSIWEQVENVAQMQYYWSDNQVSATVTFKAEEAVDIPKILELYETKLKGISFMPLRDHSYVQAPYQEITEEEYRSMIKVIKPMRFSNLDTHEANDVFCNGESCNIENGSK